MAKLNQELVATIEEKLAETPWVNPVLLATSLTQQGFRNYEIVAALKDAGIEAEEICLDGRKVKTDLPNGKTVPVGFLVGGYYCWREQLQQVCHLQTELLPLDAVEPASIDYWCDIGNWQTGYDLPNAFHVIVTHGLDLSDPVRFLMGVALQNIPVLDFPEEKCVPLDFSQFAALESA